MTEPAPDLKLVALDGEDLAVLSAHLQDAVIRVADMAYLKGERRFAAVLNRFDWANAAADPSAKPVFTRRRSGLRFDRVASAQLLNIDPAIKDAVLSVLAVQFEPDNAAEGPEGRVTLHFSGGAAIRLNVECIEAELKDLGAAWATSHRPEHADDA